MTSVEIVSFGYGHGQPPQATITFDLRQHLRDPHVSPALRQLTAADPAVVQAVLSTPGATALAEAATAAVLAMLAGPGSAPVVVAFGCVGGRHRAPVLAGETARLLTGHGITATVTHRDMQRPVIARPA